MLYFKFNDGVELPIYDAALSEAENSKLARAVEIESAKRLKRGQGDLGRVVDPTKLSSTKPADLAQIAEASA